MVKDHMVGSDNNINWWIDLNRTLNDWELQEYMKLLEVFVQKAQWKLNHSGVFSVKSFDEHLHRDDGVVENFPVSMIWKSKATPIIAFFAREAVRECFLTLDNLIKREQILVNGYYLCKRDVETGNHILLRCQFAHNLWNLTYGLLGFNWVIVGSVEMELRAWSGLGRGKRMRLIPLATF